MYNDKGMEITYGSFTLQNIIGSLKQLRRFHNNQKQQIRLQEHYSE